MKRMLMAVVLSLALIFTSCFQSDAYSIILKDKNEPIIKQEQAIACLKAHNANPKMIKAVPFIYEYATKVGVDPGLVIAMTSIETGWGKSRLFRYNNNTGGLKGKGGWQKFDTPEDGYRAHINLLATYAGLMNKHSWLYGYSKTTEGLAGMYWTNSGNDYGYHDQLTAMIKLYQRYPINKGIKKEVKEEEKKNENIITTSKKIGDINKKEENGDTKDNSALSIINNILHKDSAHKSAIDMMFDAIGK